MNRGRTGQSAAEQRALSRLRQILNEPGILRANWIQTKHRCGKSQCHCAGSKKDWHLIYYIRQTVKGKPRMKAVPSAQIEEVKRWVERYQEARELLQRIGDLYWDKVGKNPNK
jgi:hypothetical protein